MTAAEKRVDMQGPSRRDVLRGGAGLSFAFVLSAPLLEGAQAYASTPGKLNAYVNIATDGTITIMAPAPEMGQAVITSIPLIIAEELDADWSMVRIQQSPIAPEYAHPIFKSQFVVGSVTLRGYWPVIRTAGAQARRVLIDAAAEKWDVPASELTTEPSMVVHAASDRKMSYGEIASFAKVPETLPAVKPEELKPPSKFRLIGTDVPRVDVPDKVSGKPLYAIDVQLPRMLYGTIVRPPFKGSGPKSFNRDEIKKQPGIVDAVAFDHAIGIIGESVPAVFNARQKVKVEWRDAPGAKVNSEADLREYLADVRDPEKKGVTARKTGDANAAFKSAARRHTSEFTNDHVYHAQMEPHSCTASVTPDGVEVWTGTQWPTKAVTLAATAAGVSPDKVKINPLQMGGAYGRNAFVEYVTDAVLLSKVVQKPLKMIQSREDDVVAGRFRPMTAQRIDVALDANNKVTGWRHRIAAETVVPYVYGQARMDAQKGVDHIVVAGADVPFYDIPAHTTDHIYEERGVRTAAWRGIGAGYTNYAIEVVLDELARQSKQDPFAYRLALLKDPRAKKVVETAARMAEWSRKRDGRALGIAFNKLGLPPIGFSMSGTVAEISIDRRNASIRVHNIWCAVDVGLPVQPVNIVAQVEGSIIYALGSALKERITIKDGQVEQTNLHDYQIMRMSEIPQIHVEVIRSGDIPLPVGELGIGGTVPAVANAFMAMTGQTLRAMPFTPDRVRVALARS
ncbi:MAG: molybdopterin cofactor-binding domain-containing protein [Pseudorhodoplanes sp.]|jgi:isoquinoline 1-oxidoreductase beta subunit|nr:molybdopterin cofactor-binding domain-containing protein [Pseudorhodoplanes sp.]